MTKCRTESKQKKFVFKENKSKLTLVNIDEVLSESIKVDGCEINDNSLRCDYLLIAKGLEFYIELKGQNISHAIKQIQSTILKLSKNRSLKNKISFVICSRVPLTTTKVQNLQYKMMNNYNCKLYLKSSPHTFEY